MIIADLLFTCVLSVYTFHSKDYLPLVCFGIMRLLVLAHDILDKLEVKHHQEGGDAQGH